MAKPQMIKVSSSLISRIGYDEDEASTLYVEFSNGSVYAYENVTPVLYATLRDSDSIGEFFTRNIKKRPVDFPYRKVK